MFDPTDIDKVSKLVDAVRYSREEMRQFRELRHDALVQYVGHNYSESGSDDKIPFPLIELAVSVHIRQLVARNPRVMVDSPHAMLKPAASDMELDVNKSLADMDISETLRDIAKDAFFCIGIGKLGLNTAPSVTIDGVQYPYAEPFFERVDPDDFVWDMTARRPEYVGFIGNRYRVRMDEFLSTPGYNPEVQNSITTAVENYHYSYNQDNTAASLSGNDAGSRSTNKGEFEEYVELLDLWLPYDEVVVTMPDDETTRVLKVVPWDGPARGPYHMLGFDKVPDNIMPLPPVAHLKDLHMLVNALFRKMGRQAERQKNLLGYQSAAAGDAQKIVEASDSETIEMQNPNGVAEFGFGGVDQKNLSFALLMKENFSYFAGNLDALGGLSPQSDTASQDQMLTANANKRIASMQEVLVKFVTGVVRDLAWYWFHDPIRESVLLKQIPGTELSVEARISPETRMGDYIDYNFTIDPYSMQHTSPSQKLQTLTAVFQNFIAPYAPVLQEQGITINFPGLLRQIAKYADMTELPDILISADLSREAAPKSPTGRSPKPASTTRRYERVNRPGANTQGKTSAMIATLLGQNLQQSETAQLTRGVS